MVIFEILLRLLSEIIDNGISVSRVKVSVILIMMVLGNFFGLLVKFCVIFGMIYCVEK